MVQHREAFEPHRLDPWQDPSVPAFQKWLDRVEERCPVGRLLDVGCAFGTFLIVAAERGWEVHGVEVSRYAAAIAAERGLGPVFEGRFEAFDGSARSFDLVTFWDSIEHVDDPVESLRRARRLLRPDGFVLIATDNFDCLVADVAALAYRATWGHLRYPVERVFIDRNRTYFTLGTLRAALRHTGFQEVACEKMEYPLTKISASPVERWALQAFYAAAAKLGRQAQVTVLARPA